MTSVLVPALYSIADCRCITQITIMWATRPVVQKHHQYAFYHPFAEAIASMIIEFTPKLAMSICLHLPIYFLANLRHTASAFFIHWLFMLANLMTMSMLFRMIGSLSRTLEQSIPPTSVLSLLCVVYTGFIVPPDYMRPWLKWFWRINPLGYTYESLLVNEVRLILSSIEEFCLHLFPPFSFLAPFWVLSQSQEGPIAAD